MTPKPTPQAIREAAKETNPYHPVSKDNYSVFECGFIAGATHSETEKFYLNEFEQFQIWLFESDWKPMTMKIFEDKSIHYYSESLNKNIPFTDILQLYRESQTNKNKEG